MMEKIQSLKCGVQTSPHPAAADAARTSPQGEEKGDVYV